MKKTLSLMPLLCIVFCLLNTNTYSKADNSSVKNLSRNSSIIIANWVSSQTYVVGDYVTYENKVFRATHWTQGDTPRGFGLYPDGPWMYEGLYN
jgi:chitodextrinase